MLEVELDVPASVAVELLVEEASVRPEYVEGVQGEVVQVQDRWQVNFSHGGLARYRVEMTERKGE